jgi:hypothetical protein
MKDYEEIENMADEITSEIACYTMVIAFCEEKIKKLKSRDVEAEFYINNSDFPDYNFKPGGTD